MGNVVIKANTTILNATKLVIPLTTSTSVSAFIADAIITSKVNELHGTTAKVLLGQIRAVHKGTEMEANEVVLTYMNDDEKQHQVASDIEIDFPEGTLTTLAIEQLIFFKNNVAIAHPNSHRSSPITALGSVGFSETDTN